MLLGQSSDKKLWAAASQRSTDWTVIRFFRTVSEALLNLSLQTVFVTLDLYLQIIFVILFVHNPFSVKAIQALFNLLLETEPLLRGKQQKSLIVSRWILCLSWSTMSLFRSISIVPFPNHYFPRRVCLFKTSFLGIRLKGRSYSLLLNKNKAWTAS